MFKNLKKSNGHTLIEVMSAMIIASIMIWGFYQTFVYGIERYNEALSKQLMLNEGSTKLRYIEWLVRSADEIEIHDSDSPLRSRLVLKYPDDEQTNANERIVLFANSNNGTLRIHYYRDGKNDSDRRVLPITRYSTNARHQGSTEYPYEVIKIKFSYGDSSVFDIYDDLQIPTDSLKNILKFDLVLGDSDSNQVALTSWQSKLN